jgi:hypothetical protein
MIASRSSGKMPCTDAPGRRSSTANTPSVSPAAHLIQVQAKQQCGAAGRPTGLHRMLEQLQQAGPDARVHPRRDPAGTQSQRAFPRADATPPPARPPWHAAARPPPVPGPARPAPPSARAARAPTRPAHPARPASPSGRCAPPWSDPPHTGPRPPAACTARTPSRKSAHTRYGPGRAAVKKQAAGRHVRLSGRRREPDQCPLRQPPQCADADQSHPTTSTPEPPISEPATQRSKRTGSARHR